MTKQEYLNNIQKIKRQNQQAEMRKNLRKLKAKRYPKFKLPSTSKIVLWAVILLNFQIIWFVEKAMMQWGDFSAIYALIGIPATLIPIVWAYYAKSKAENTKGGIIYDSAMAQINQPHDFSDETDSDGCVG